MEEDCAILSGPVEDNFIPEEPTLGEYIFDCLKNRNKYDLVAIDGITNRTLTCGGLIQQAIKLINILKDQGIKQGDAVSFSSENSIEFLIPVVAAFCMGVTLNLINVNFTVGEIKRALSIVKPKLVICTESILANIEEAVKNGDPIKIVLFGSNCHRQGVICFNSTNHSRYDYVPVHFDSAKQGALIVFSSGTTGLPKGVLITHQTLKHYIFSACHPSYGGYSSNQVLLAVLPMFFMYGFLAPLSALINPIKLVVLKKFNPTTFLRAIELHKVTVLPVAPPIVHFLAKSPMVKERDLSTLKIISSAGSFLARKVADEALNAIGGNVQITQGYGLSELGSCTYEPPNLPRGSIGRLVLNYKAKVWKAETQQNVGPLEIGELCFKRPTPILPYLDCTVDNSFVDRENFFHTGDLGYYDHDGYFYVTGRIKDIIKYKAFQVSPTELEDLLLQHPDVKDCGVIGIPNERTGEAPLAYVVCEDSSLTENDVVQFVAERISLQKQLHGGVRFVKQIPRNSSGKISRNVLREMYKNETV